MDNFQELSNRLQMLERQHYRLKVFAVLAAIVACSLMLMGQVRPPFDRPLPPSTQSAIVQTPTHEGTIRAEAFILTDANGKERASLVTDGTGSVFLVLFDVNGKPRADLQVNNFGPSLNFYDPNAKTRVALGSTTLVASHVNNGGIMEKNTPSSIVLFDASGQLLWRTP
jgi:hypothetical protein